jgi:hypothetical protein
MSLYDADARALLPDPAESKAATSTILQYFLDIRFNGEVKVEGMTGAFREHVLYHKRTCGIPDHNTLVYHNRLISYDDKW